MELLNFTESNNPIVSTDFYIYEKSRMSLDFLDVSYYSSKRYKNHITIIVRNSIEPITDKNLTRWNW